MWTWMSVWGILRDKFGKRLLRSCRQIFPRTASSSAASWVWYRGGQGKENFSYPIVVRNFIGTGDFTEYFDKNNENGFIMEPGDKIAIYHAISKLMANEAMTKRMGENSLNKVQEHLPDYVARQLQTLYDSLV